MAVDAIKICDTWPYVEASDWPHDPCQASHWPMPRPGAPPCPWYGWPRHDDTGTWHGASQTCHNTSRSATWYKYDGLLMWPIIICSHVMISGGSEISSAGNIRELHYLMNDPRLEIECVSLAEAEDLEEDVRVKGSGEIHQWVKKAPYVQKTRDSLLEF